MRRSACPARLPVPRHICHRSRRPAGQVDARSDIFSFGAMLYEMVTGVRAFSGHVRGRHAERRGPRGTQAAECDPYQRADDLEKVILRCLRKDPARRFQHIDDVNVALHEIKEDSESGTAVTLPPRKRGRIRVTLVATALLILMTGIAGWLLRRPGPTQHSALAGRATHGPAGARAVADLLSGRHAGGVRMGR